MTFLKAWLMFAVLISAVLACRGAEPGSVAATSEMASSQQAAPGQLLYYAPMTGAPMGASAYRVIYRSTATDGGPMQVSGMIIVPAGPPPEGGRQIVAWAHGTTGVATSCAPSLAAQPFSHVMGLENLLAAGYIVTATDYPSLGEPGPPFYLIGDVEGHAVLDSVRAARQLIPGTGTRFAVWGHSQGAHSALFARQLAASYAPELQLVGVATAAPPTNLSALLNADIGEPVGKIVASFTLWSWSRAYGADLRQIVYARALPRVNDIAGNCTDTLGDAVGDIAQTFGLRRQFLQPDFATTEPWRALLARNTPSAAANGVPLFVAQGTKDRIVRPTVTASFVDSLCTNGVPVHYLVVPGAGHNPSGKLSAPKAVQWIQDRFAGLPPPNDCALRSTAAAY